MFGLFKKKEKIPPKEWVYMGTITRIYSDSRQPYIIVKAYINKADLYDRKVEFTYTDYYHSDFGRRYSDRVISQWSAGLGLPFWALDSLSKEGYDFLISEGFKKEHDLWYVKKDSKHYDYVTANFLDKKKEKKQKATWDNTDKPEEPIPDINNGLDV